MYCDMLGGGGGGIKLCFYKCKNSYDNPSSIIYSMYATLISLIKM